MTKIPVFSARGVLQQKIVVPLVLGSPEGKRYCCRVAQVGALSIALSLALAMVR